MYTTEAIRCMSLHVIYIVCVYKRKAENIYNLSTRVTVPFEQVSVCDYAIGIVVPYIIWRRDKYYAYSLYKHSTVRFEASLCMLLHAISIVILYIQFGGLTNFISILQVHITGSPFTLGQVFVFDLCVG